MWTGEETDEEIKEFNKELRDSGRFLWSSLIGIFVSICLVAIFGIWTVGMNSNSTASIWDSFWSGIDAIKNISGSPSPESIFIGFISVSIAIAVAFSGSIKILSDRDDDLFDVEQDIRRLNTSDCKPITRIHPDPAGRMDLEVRRKIILRSLIRLKFVSQVDLVATLFVAVGSIIIFLMLIRSGSYIISGCSAVLTLYIIISIFRGHIAIDQVRDLDEKPIPSEIGKFLGAIAELDYKQPYLRWTLILWSMIYISCSIAIATAIKWGDQGSVASIFISNNVIFLISSMLLESLSGGNLNRATGIRRSENRLAFIACLIIWSVLCFSIFWVYYEYNSDLSTTLCWALINWLIGVALFKSRSLGYEGKFIFKSLAARPAMKAAMVLRGSDSTADRKTYNELRKIGKSLNLFDVTVVKDRHEFKIGRWKLCTNILLWIVSYNNIYYKWKRDRDLRIYRGFAGWIFSILAPASCHTRLG